MKGFTTMQEQAESDIIIISEEVMNVGGGSGGHGGNCTMSITFNATIIMSNGGGQSKLIELCMIVKHYHAEASDHTIHR